MDLQAFLHFPLHRRGLLKLTEIDSGIANAKIGKIIFLRCFNICDPSFCASAHFLVMIFHHKTIYVSIFIPILCVYAYFYVMH